MKVQACPSGQSAIRTCKQHPCGQEDCAQKRDVQRQTAVCIGVRHASRNSDGNPLLRRGNVAVRPTRAK